MRFCLPLLCILATGAVQASPDTDFQAAHDAFQKGHGDRVVRIAARFPDGHPLAPYVQFWRLRSIDASTTQKLAFIEHYPGTALVERVRGDLARDFGHNENWSAFRIQFQALAKPDQELQCFDLRARLAEADPTADKAGVELWLTARDLPSSCDPLFARLAERGLIGLEERLERLRLALDAGNLRLAREIQGQLPDGQRWASDTLARAQRHGEGLLAEAPEARGQREAALYALTQFARADADGAFRLWGQYAGKFSEDEQRYGWGQIALHAARGHHPSALQWFERAGQPMSEQQAQWKARAALRAGRWNEVFNAIQSLPESVRNEPVWRYWKARSFRALRADYPANVLFAKLSQEINYYGLLATEELPPSIEARPRRYKVTPDDLKAARANPGLVRALMLRRLGDAGNAVSEWEWSLRSMNDRQILAAAELALREKWNDRAIVTAEKTLEEHDFDLRYIAPYRDLASSYAASNGLDEAWVYGLMRQESRFIEQARSSAGASGLMQIMPATARWIARQLGLRRNAHRAVAKPDVNIRFGTYYLKRIYTALDKSPVLATAAYNAGPMRARKWQATVPLEGAIYVEDIPFAETRNYVKKVMANAMFYRNRFGGDVMPLKDRLGTIPARGGSLPADIDETTPAPE